MRRASVTLYAVLATLAVPLAWTKQSPSEPTPLTVTDAPDAALSDLPPETVATMLERIRTAGTGASQAACAPGVLLAGCPPVLSPRSRQNWTSNLSVRMGAPSLHGWTGSPSLQRWGAPFRHANQSPTYQDVGNPMLEELGRSGVDALIDLNHLDDRATQPMHPTRLLVRLKRDAAAPGRRRPQGAALQLAAQWFLDRGHRLVTQYPLVDDLCLVEVPAGELQAALDAYSNDPNVLYAEPDYPVHTTGVPNDPDFPLLWGMENTGQTINGDPGTAGADIRAVPAWDLWTGDQEFRIAVIDTGIDYNHPDLSANVWTNPLEQAGDANSDGCPGVCGIDDDGDGEIDEVPEHLHPGEQPEWDDDENGWVDDVHGYDTYNEDSDPMDDNFHGSHVAGTIGAVGDNGLGVVGVNWRCRLVGVKAFSSQGGGYTSDVVEAIQYVIDSAIPLSNNSWVSVYYSQALYDVMAQAGAVGHLFVVAAGNFWGRDIDQNPVYPATFDLPNILTVGSIDNDDKLAIFSNIGSTHVDLSAPGHNIFSTLAGGDYGYFHGTSMSAPHVTGVAALLMSRRPDLNWYQVKDRILRTTRPVEAITDYTLTGGVVHAAAAVGDCNGNGVLDEQDIAAGTSTDCNADQLPDECEPDCNGNGAPDDCDITDAFSIDCNGNAAPDECDIAGGLSGDCNANAVPDECDLAGGFSADVNESGVPDECETCDDDGDCDDGDVCTFEQCIDALCYVTYNTAPCDDGIACTENDVCSEGYCTGTLISGPECAPVFSIQATALNSVPLPTGPTGEITITRGDRLTVELFVERWIPRTIRAYNALIDPGGYSSGATGRLLPADDPDPPAARFIDQARPDWMFFDRPAIAVVWIGGTVFTQYGGIVLLDDGCEPDSGSPAYLGTLVLDASETASGTFTLCLYEDTLHTTFLIDCPTNMNIRESTSACLTIQVPLTDCTGLPDCNDNGQWDVCDINEGFSLDCNRNDIPDECDLADANSPDCNANAIPDECDLASGTSDDCEGGPGNGIPDECEPDCTADGVPDSCELAQGLHEDCNANQIPDACDIAQATSSDCNGEFGNDIPDECEPDCNANEVADSCDLALGDSVDSDENGIPDECQSLRRVPQDYGTIQAAIDDTAPGDIVLLSDGIYTGQGNTPVDFGGRLLTLQSENGPANCIIDGGEDQRALYLVSAEPPGTRIQGLTFTNCLVAITLDHGADPRIRDCLFADNYVGIIADESAPTIHGCTFTGHTSSTCVHLTQGSDASIIDCDFVGNDSGGISALTSNATILNCRIVDNRGIGIYCTRGTPRIRNCLIARNGDSSTGSGIHCRECSPVISNCTIVDTRRPLHPGIYCRRGSRPALYNSIVWGYDVFDGASVTLLEGSTLSVAYCDFEGGPDAVYADEYSSLVYKKGNFSADPLFVGGDLWDAGVAPAYDLSPRSPCINTGSPRFTATEGEKDLAGRPRVIFGVVDMGAYEAEHHFDCNDNGVPDGEDVVTHDSEDCNGNVIPDECDLSGGASVDCNWNNIPDECDIAAGGDCDANDVPDECEEDSDDDGTIDACDGCPNDEDKTEPGLCGCGVSEHDGDEDTIPDCVDLCEGFDDLEDCNENDYPDGCDILEGSSADYNGNGVPDECERPTVEARGGRYLAVTPFSAAQTVALLVTGVSDDPAISCVSLYVQADGSLDAAPLFQTPDDWGTVHVFGEEIVPSVLADKLILPATYHVQADHGSAGAPDLSLPSPVSMWIWGDVDNSGSVDNRDAQLVVRGMQGLFEDATAESADLAPCRPNGLVNISDLQQVLKAIAGGSFESGMCLAPCR